MLKSIPARIVFWQLMVGVAGAILSAALIGAKAALGAFTGGAIAALLSLYFAMKTFSRRGADPQAVVQAFYRAEALKLVMATGLFVLVAVFLADVWLPLITTFIASQAVYGFALIWKSGDGY
ncbi:MAG: ATP synthase subunit I [Gammaproteobacteria bacterium]|nr:ATP synthase subunit I [Gammaproteobacteria bacterium]